MRLNVLALAAPVLAVAPAAAQQPNLPITAADAEARFAGHAFEVEEIRTLRPTGLTRAAGLRFEDGMAVWAKWDPAPRGGAADNNEPRYEIGAYRLQTLFLSEPEYVVPPTVARVLPVSWLRERGLPAAPTFGSESALVVLQLWLQDVTSSGVWDERRLATDSAYAHNLANLNILTYLIRHGDANTGNLLISRDPANPRVFSVDNGIAFSAPPNPNAHEWRDLRVRRLPRATVERLRAITPADLEAALGVVIQLERRDGELVLVEPTANLRPGRAVRQRGAVIQLGLTEREIRGVQQRLRALLRDVDRGWIGTF